VSRNAKVLNGTLFSPRRALLGKPAQEVYHDAPELLEFVKTFLNK
jgi:hypothetical protein